MKRLYLIALTLLLLISCSASDADSTITETTLLHEMVDRDALARFPEPAYTCKEATSYDRRSVAPNLPGWFANHDTANYVRTENNNGRTEYVMMDADGPGAIVCFFKASTNPLAVVRIYLDDSPIPTVEENERYLLGGGGETVQEHNYFEKRVPPYPVDETHFLGGYGTIKPPLAGVYSLGCDMYLPIPYAKHCKVTYDLPGNDFYRIEYRTYTTGTAVKTFTLHDLADNAQLIQSVGDSLMRPQIMSGDQIMEMNPALKTLAEGQATSLELHNGPYALSSLSIKLSAASMAQALRTTIIKMSFDDNQTVWCPIGDFFASGIGINPSTNWDRAVDADGTMHCWWTMPYRKSCNIALVNIGNQPVSAWIGNTAGRPWTWDDRSMYFHANWRQQYPIQTVAGDGTMDWNYLEASGKGVYVGDALVIHNGSSKWWGEGDEKVWIDGDTFPSLFGTGTEDYYGYSRGGDASESFESPFIDHPQVEGDKQIGYSSLTKVRLLDGIPFTNHLKFDMEIWHWDATTVAYAATTYWYAEPGATSNHGPDVDAAKIPLLDDNMVPK